MTFGLFFVKFLSCLLYFKCKVLHAKVDGTIIGNAAYSKKMNQVVHPEYKKAHPTEILPPIVTSVTAIVTYLCPALDTKWEPQLLLSP